MPSRNVPLCTDEIYHVINRGFLEKEIYKTERDYLRFLDILGYYKYFTDSSTRYSNYINLSENTKKSQLNRMILKNEKEVDILAYSLLPNHFHLLLKQKREDGVKNFISKVSNSYSHFFNKINSRKGALYQGRFKAVQVRSESHFLHLFRYIHLNLFSAHVVLNIDDLKHSYKTSFSEYLGTSKFDLCDKEMFSSYFKNKNDIEKFIIERAQYQRFLEKIKKNVSM
ncbi:hypothetical protein COV24_04510 [candidate division WWE3 bacterium CG10_big_fil_rev_8_21_14_0_10_32_10]|uniref:Transposase IS200-like domain-containing protein n=1 Tax=candidate division WWE3 bacterium CG10_big_fil_rev_8_21_14_0_10_32_10 TaxID=1975090 RepID=A0A2H0R9A8_UNCKA|nr:MAG: hypothetical protein COV24_04510 [candidate division WWE3 bacterium CG10_big_fil_rev_8_21_14_0_10_32_10]